MFDEAREWVSSTDRSWLFSFENICDTLEINADYVRRGLREWKERGGLPRRAKLPELAAGPAPDLQEAAASASA